MAPILVAPTAPPCNMIYLDIGTNVGDSLAAFSRSQPELRLAETIKVAVGNTWSPSTTCVYGFEPNPRWTKRLRDLNARLASSFSSLTIYTETAVGGPEQLAHPLWLVQEGARGVGSYLSSSPPRKHANATTVATFSLAEWLRDVCVKQHGWQTPVVMRMDVEGTEYDILPDLATSGLGRQMQLYLTVEWHRQVKASSLGSRERAHMAMLDDAFLRYPYRCGDGSCAGTHQANAPVPELIRLANSTLEGNLEKTLAYMLHRSGITFVDAFNHRREDPAIWNATRHRNWETWRARSGTGSGTVTTRERA